MKVMQTKHKKKKFRKNYVFYYPQNLVYKKQASV